MVRQLLLMDMKRLLVILPIAIIAGAVGFLAADRVFQSAEPELASVLPQPRALPDFELVNHRGEPVANEEFAGQWDILFFGYTNCPDICPPTLSMLDRMVNQMEAAGEAAPRIVFVSVDPERDTPERLDEYVGYFNADFLGVTGPQDQLDRFTRSLGIVSMKIDADDSDAEYLVDHSGTLVVLDPDGHQHAVLTTPLAHEMETIATDLARIRGAYR